MVDHLLTLKAQYEQAVNNFLEKGGEFSLAEAYECGRAFLAQGLGVQEMATIHHDILMPLIGSCSDPLTILDLYDKSDKILRESLSPFEVTYRGYRESNERLRTLVGKLEERSEELAKALRDKETAEELLKAEEKYRVLVEATRAALFSVDLNGRITYVNEEGARSLGFSRAVLIGKRALQFVHREDRRRILSAIASHGVASGTKNLLEFRYVGKEKGGWCSLFLSQLKSGERLAGFTGIALDTTELKNSEQKLKELYAVAERHLSELRAVVESMPDAVYMGTRDGITLCNARALQMFGAQTLSDLQLPVRELAHILRLRRPGSGRLLLEQELPFSRALSGETVEEELLAVNVTTKKDVYIRCAAAPLMEAGAVVGAVAVNADITERRQLQNERFHMASIIESSDDAIFSKTLDGIILTWNKGAERLYGYSANEIVGKDVTLLTPEGREGEVGEFLEKVRGGHSVEHFETARMRKDGTVLYVSVTISPIRDENGEVTGASTIARDITERKRAEEDVRRMNANLEKLVKERTAHLEAINKELEAFSYSVSHDLRAPLRAIDGFAKMLLTKYVSQLDDQGNHYLNVIRASANKMGRLIDDLLAFSRFGRIEFEKGQIDMSRLAQSVYDELRETYSGNVITLLIRTMPPAWGNSALLRQVLANLISNAMKFTKMRETPFIEIGGNQSGREAVYFVKDNGIGFNMRYADKLFGVFQRLHKTDQFEGTGVGLAIVQRVVQRHGGRVWAQGKANEGAVFYFSLPMNPEDP